MTINRCVLLMVMEGNENVVPIFYQYPAPKKISQFSFLTDEVARFQKELENLAKRTTSAILIQFHFRCHLKKIHRPIRIAAVACISRCWLTFKFRVAISERLGARLFVKAGRKILRAWRLYKWRILVLKSGLLLKAARAFSEAVMLRKDAAAKRIGRRWKLLSFARNLKRTESTRNRAARILQKWWRAHYNKKIIQRQQLIKKESIALKFGLRWRRKAAERKRQRMIDSIRELEIIQALKRKNWADEKYLEIVIRKIQIIWREKILAKKLISLRRKRASVQIQKMWRAKLFKRNQDKMSRAASSLQALFRGRMARKGYTCLRAMIIRVQAHWRGLVARRRVADLMAKQNSLLEQEKAINVLTAMLDHHSIAYRDLLVRKVQAHWRGRIIRRRIEDEKMNRKFQLQRNAVLTKVQSLWRGLRARRKIATLHQAALVIQKKFRAHLTKAAYEALRGMVGRAQRIWRGAIARARVRKIKEEISRLKSLATAAEVGLALMGHNEEKYKELLVRKIQAIWRGKIFRRRLQEETDLEISFRKLHVREKAATKLQALFRGIQGRKEVLSFRAEEILRRFGPVSRNFQVQSESSTTTHGLAVFPTDLEGTLERGIFLTGPLRGKSLKEVKEDEWELDEVIVEKKLKKEFVVDVSRAAMCIQTFWRGIKLRHETERNLLIALSGTRSRLLFDGMNKKSSFDSKRVQSGTVEVKGNSAEYVGVKKSDDFQEPPILGGFGLVFADRPLPLIRTRKSGVCLYFQVLLTGIFPGNFPDGLTLGVTDQLPETIPETCDGLTGEVWAVGFDGSSYCSKDNEFIPIDWNPRSLKIGDEVGCMVVYPAGDLLVVVNGEIVAEGPGEVPISRSLYGFVDLLGNAKKVTWGGWEHLPDIELVEGGKETRGDFDKRLIAELEYEKSINPVEEQIVQDTGDDTLQLDESLAVDGIVEISDNTAEYIGAKQPGSQYVARGVVISEEPVKEKVTDRLYFEVQLTTVQKGFPDGLTLGYTNIKPNSSEEIPDTCDGLPGQVWAVGFDGHYFDSVNDTFEKIDWNPNNLRKGDKVGALIVFPDGDLLILVNGEIVAEGPSHIPQNTPLYAVIDLLGSASGVKLHTHPKVPPIDLNN